MLPIPRVLLLVCDAGERNVLERTLTRHAELTWAGDPLELARHLLTSEFDVVFCARALFRNSWKDVLEQVREIDSDVPVVIVSRTASEAEWAEVLEAGAFDLLGPPYRECDLLPVVKYAAAFHLSRAEGDDVAIPSAALN